MLIHVEIKVYTLLYDNFTRLELPNDSLILYLAVFLNCVPSFWSIGARSCDEFTRIRVHGYKCKNTQVLQSLARHSMYIKIYRPQGHVILCS